MQNFWQKKKNQLNIFITKVVLARTIPVSQQTIPIYRTTSDNVRQYSGGGIGNTMTMRKMINERNVYQEDGYVNVDLRTDEATRVEYLNEIAEMIYSSRTENQNT